MNEALKYFEGLYDRSEREYQAALEEIRNANISNNVRSRAFACLAVERSKEISNIKFAIREL